MKKILIYNICIFFSLFLLLEISIRVLNLANLLGIKSDIVIKNSNPISYYPNKSSVVFGKKIFTDKYGFRITEKNYKYNGDEKILILGDSTSYGVGVVEAKTFIGLIRKKYPNINIYNTSITGHDIDDHILITKKFKTQLDINKLIIFLNLNDIHFQDEGAKIQNLNINEDKKKFTDKLKGFYFLGKANFFLRSKSALYVYVKSVLTLPSERHFKRTYDFYNNKVNLLNYEKKLDEFLEIVGDNLDLSIIILPWEYQTRNNCINKDLFLPQDFISNYFKNKKINYVNFSKDFCNVKAKDMYLKFDPAHLSDDGHTFVESLIVKNNLF